AVGTSYEALAKWLIYSTIKNGVDQTIQYLLDFINLDYAPGYHIIAISGLEIGDGTNITNDIKLIPFDSVPESLPKDMFSLPIKTMSPFLFAQNFPKAALICKVKLTPKVLDQTGNIPKRVDSVKMYDAFDILSLTLKGSLSLVCAWYALEDWVPSYGIGGLVWSGPNSDIVITTVEKITLIDIEAYKKIFNLFSSLHASTRNKLRIPIRRLNQAQRRQNLADKAIDLGIALESLLLSDNKIPEQISLSFRLRGAWFLSQNATERKDIYNLLYDIYNCRSMAIHAGRIGSKSKFKSGNTASEVLEKGIEFCSISIKSIIDKGKFPTWNDLILGVSE
ncbi:hypothetical protein KA005_27850, partial [bacterium]|nr:hypothetical protein [bacterium]